jgi:hypothetical protein
VRACDASDGFQRTIALLAKVHAFGYAGETVLDDVTIIRSPGANTGMPGGYNDALSAEIRPPASVDARDFALHVKALHGGASGANNLCN